MEHCAGRADCKIGTPENDHFHPENDNFHELRAILNGDDHDDIGEIPNYD